MDGAAVECFGGVAARAFGAADLPAGATVLPNGTVMAEACFGCSAAGMAGTAGSTFDCGATTATRAGDGTGLARTGEGAGDLATATRVVAATRAGDVVAEARAGDRPLRQGLPGVVGAVCRRWRTGAGLLPSSGLVP